MLHAVVDKIKTYGTLGAEINELIDPQVQPLRLLTFREGEVLSLIGQGLSNNQIAEILQLSVQTVEAHRRNLSGKLGLKGAELMHYATRQSLQPG